MKIEKGKPSSIVKAIMNVTSPTSILHMGNKIYVI